MSLEDKLRKLVAADIQLLPAVEITTHFLFERDGFIALVERRGSEFGAVGAGGLATEKGLAPLVWRGTEPWFVTKGFEQPATPQQIEQLRGFQADLESALS